MTHPITTFMCSPWSWLLRLLLLRRHFQSLSPVQLLNTSSWLFNGHLRSLNDVSVCLSQMSLQYVYWPVPINFLVATDINIDGRVISTLLSPEKRPQFTELSTQSKNTIHCRQFNQFSLVSSSTHPLKQQPQLQWAFYATLQRLNCCGQQLFSTTIRHFHLKAATRNRDIGLCNLSLGVLFVAIKCPLFY